MTRVTLLALGLLFMSVASGQALTVDEIVKLKQAGVSDATIDLLIKRGGDARSAGVWKQDGWIIHSTESRIFDAPNNEYYQDGYPLAVYPQFSVGRRVGPHKP